MFVDGLLAKFDPATGSQRWATATKCCGTSHTSPTIADGRVFIGRACAETEAYDAAGGKLLWHHVEGCTGGGGKTVGYWNGRVYVRESYEGDPPLLDAATGNPIGRWPGGFVPSFTGDTGLFAAGDASLTAVTLPGHAVRWSHAGILAPPLVINGRVVASTSAGIVALDSASGRELWRDPEVIGASPDEHNVSEPVAGLGAGDGIFAVPTGNGLLVAYEHGTGPGAPVPGSQSPGATVPGAPPPTGASAPTLDILLKRRILFLGERTRLLGRLSGTAVLGGRLVALQLDEHPYGSRWRTAARARTTADGTFGFLVAPRRNSRLRVVLTDERAISPAIELFAEFPFRARENSRAGTVTLTLYAFRGAKVRTRPLVAYWTTGRTRPWTRVGRTRWHVATRRFVRATVRFPRGLLRRRGAHWVICQPEPVPDGIGRPSEFERRCGERTLPRGLS